MSSFIHFSKNVNLFILLAVDTAALIGFLFILRAFLKLKIYGEMRSMMAPHARINQILLLLVTGSALIYLPHATQDILRDAILGCSEIQGLSYHAVASFEQDIKEAAMSVMQLIGYIALIRGIAQLGSYQEGGRHSLGKSMTHIVAGVCGINIHQTLDLLNSLVGKK